MKLVNRKTGKIGNFCYGPTEGLCVAWQKDDGFWDKKEYSSLAELNAEWEDAPEEPKGRALYWTILTLANFIENEPDDKWVDIDDCKDLLEKLKAWEQLRDKGFRFDGYNSITRSIDYDVDSNEDIREELFTLFGGEE